jgi:Uma2 family endonuclease
MARERMCGGRPGAGLAAAAGCARVQSMDVALRKPMTLAEFLAWEERQELRYEFDGIEPLAMTGGTDAHEAIGNRLRAMLLDRLQGKPCRPRGPTLKIEVAGRIRYPDAFVSCTPVPRNATVIRDPVVVFEVASASTSRTDRIDKLREYQATESIRRYVIVEQDSIAATVFSRLGSDWIARALTAGDLLQMPEIGIEIPLADIYADVPLGAPEGEGEASSA